MNECIDKRLGNLLYAYEIDLLSDEEREEFEIHLLECKYCNDRVQNFQAATDIIKHDKEIKDVVARLDIVKAIPKKPSGTYIKSILAVAAVLVILILKPWQIEFQSTKEARAIENRLAVLYFENLASPSDPDRTGEIITDLLITDLSQSQFLEVLSYQRLNDIVKQIGHKNNNSFNDMESEIAELGRANWILTGKVHQIEPKIILTAQLTNLSSNNITGTYQIEAGTNENLFMLVDKLTKKVKLDLSLPSYAQNEFDSPIAEVTTHSQKAYLHYLEGIDYNFRLYFKEAKQSFEMALEYDSTFSMAYYYLAPLDYANAESLISKALKYSAKLNTRERFYIKSREAFISGKDSLAIKLLWDIVHKYPHEKMALYQLAVYEYEDNNLQKAIILFENIIEIDPFDTKTINRLAYIYDHAGEFEKAIEVANKYVEVAPNDANPYDTRGELFAKHGRLDEAIESYQKAVSIKPDFGGYNTLLSLGRLYVYSGKYEKARECFQEVIIQGNRLPRSLARTFMATIPLYQGKLNEALQILEDGITVDKMELASAGDNGAESYKHYMKARIHVEKNEMDIAAFELKEAIRVHNIVFSSNQPAFRCMYAEVLAEGSNYKAAEEIIATLEKEYLAGETAAQSGYWYAVGSVELAKGNNRQSVEALKKCVAAGPYYDFKILLAKALVKAGEYDEAITLYSNLLIDYTGRFRLYQSIESVKAYYYFGIAYENTNQTDKALELYNNFLSIWKNADIEFDEIVDARKRLTQINKGV